MVHVYYHIYAVEGVESIIDEQINLIQKHFDFPYTLNVGISIANENISSKTIIEKFYNFNKPNYIIRDIRCKGNEFVTLDLIMEDKDKLSDTDYILYIHTKGASKQKEAVYENVKSWRRMMQYFLIEKYKSVFRVFDNTEFNTYGVLLNQIGNFKLHYSGNFWWMKGKYAKTLDLTGIKANRSAAEVNFIQNGIDWNPYSPYNNDAINNYEIHFNREQYAK